MKKAIVICGGEINIKRLPPIDFEGNFVICADCGLSTAAELMITPNLAIGDFDSAVLPENPSFEVIRLNSEKDITDTFAAVDEAVRRGYDDILILGAIGGRVDHTLANMALFQYFEGVRLVIENGDNEIFCLKGGSMSIQKGTRKYLSLLPFSGDALGVTVTGVKYPLNGAVLTTGFPLGVSNEITGREATVSVRKGRLLIIRSQDTG